MCQYLYEYKKWKILEMATNYRYRTRKSTSRGRSRGAKPRRRTAARRPRRRSNPHYGPGLPANTTLQKFTYKHEVTLSGFGTDQPGDIAYRANNPFHVSAYDTTHQPIGCDQYALMYRRFLCYGCSYHFQCSLDTDGYIGLNVSRDSGSMGTLNTREKVLSDKHTYARFVVKQETSNTQIVHMKGRISAHKVYGKPYSEREDHNFVGEPGTGTVASVVDPALQVYLFLWCVSTGNTLPNLKGYVTIVYYTKMFRSKNILDSAT